MSTVGFTVPTSGEVEYNPQAVALSFASEGEVAYNPRSVAFQLGVSADIYYTQSGTQVFEFGAAAEVGYDARTNDNFDFRTVFNALPYSDALDLASNTRVLGEPNASMVKTAWYEYAPPNFFPEVVKVTAGPGSVFVFKRTVIDDDTDEDIDPEFSELTQILALSPGQTGLIVTSDDDGSYYIQLGTSNPAGVVATLDVSDATPEPGGTFATAQPIGGVWGSHQLSTRNGLIEAGEPTPAGITPVASSWLTWTPSTDTEVIFTLLGLASLSGTSAITFYTGSTLAGLTQVATAVGPATATKSIQLTPTPGTTYHIQIATTVELSTFALSWGGAPQLVEPQDVPSYLRVEVYEKDGKTLITEVVNRSGCTFSESLNESATGNISISMRDEVFKIYPTLLNDGNIVKFWLGPKCVSGFRIQSRQIQWISDGEAGGIALTAAGPTLNYLLNDFVCHHDTGATSASGTSRYFSWASRPDPVWYNVALWNHKIMASTQKNPPGSWKKKAKKRPRYKKPKTWPDKKSYWFWITTSTSRNGGWTPPYSIENRYYRTNVNVPAAGQTYEMMATGDNKVRVYLDGDLVISRGTTDTSYTSWSKYRIVLSAGTHTIAAHQISTTDKKDDGVDAFMFSMYLMKKNKKKKLVRKTVVARTEAGGRGWVAFYGPTPPSWCRAAIFAGQIKEARERGNDAALALDISEFDTVTAADGVKWYDTWSQEVAIGASGYEILQQFSEGNYFDVAVEPATLKVRGWTHKGTNKSASIALVPGNNLLDFQFTETDNVANDVYAHYDGGFTRVQQNSSIATYGHREAYLEIAGVKTQEAANTLVTRVMDGIASAVSSAGSPEWRQKSIYDRDTGGVIGVHGAYPFIDYDVGDTISAPSGTNGVGSYSTYRVLALSCTEDDNGNLTFDPTLEEVTS